ncbi:hypothetical protein MKX01_033028 [Papaver californicum]|nr:hypothetical protein MKX01_033028 [Papaver californicum]
MGNNRDEISLTRSPAGKWLGFVTAIWVQAISGNNYTFSNYSDALKSLMALTQLELNSLSVAKDIGKAFGILAGLASDRLSTPVILLIGSVEGFIGYGVQWLVVSQRIRPLPYWQMSIFLCMGGNSTTWMNTAILVTCMRNFRRNRGPVSGILKGYVGLSTAIFTDICSALFADNPSKFLLMLAVVPAVVCLAAIFFLREVPPTTTAAQEEEESKYFNFFNIVAVIMNAATPRPLWNAASQVLMAVGYIILAIALPGSLYIGSIVVGVCYGVRLAVTVPTASELFGLKNYGLIYNILILNLPLGSFLFSGLLAGLLYDAEATKTEGGGNTCVGAHCYRLVFVIMALACVVGFVLDVILVLRTKNLYKKIQASKKSRKSGLEQKRTIKG